jgi:anhydro-N-acetylmuramic acid kinase
VDRRLLGVMLADPYFARQPPKSTGRDLFNMAWLEQQLGPTYERDAADVQATLAELTATAVAREVDRHEPKLKQLIVCGGGALNAHLMTRLRELLPRAHVVPSTDAGLPPLQVEAAAFAWLARQCMRREALDLKSTTGAKGARILGAIYPR